MEDLERREQCSDQQKETTPPALKARLRAVFDLFDADNEEHIEKYMEMMGQTRRDGRANKGLLMAE